MNNSINKQARIRYRIALDSGKCPKHPTVNVVLDKTQCRKCIEIQRIRAKRHIENGMCPSHPSQKQLPGLTTCILCRKSRQRREYECIIRGICVNSGCNNKTLDGNHTCPIHKWYSAAQTAGVTVQILDEIYEEQNGRCILSGIKIVKGVNASPDHIISKNDGGLNTKENIRLTDWMVNRALGKETDE